ncbi:MAG: GTPase ObgE [Bacteroidales bacterium]|nr:GTPase ObgE [Bacteroidales bacterium]
MGESNFIDYVKIFCKSGKGGAGSVHLRHEKSKPRGGPDGGNGGRGGHVVIKGNKQLWTLLHLKYTKHIIAKDGEKGSSNLCTGADGNDALIEVPLGTIIKNFETKETELEITEDGEVKVMMSGGRGGMGNHHFKTSTHQTPRFAQPGEQGTEGWKIFELKLLADVGLVGFPNAGKSTLLSVVSAAKPEIADYPFTTLVPNLGVVAYREHRSFVMADIPGIIEGASEGKGLGLRFLRHIERNSLLLFIIPINSKNIKKEYEILLNELKTYNPELLDKKIILAISKSDLMPENEIKKIKKNIPKIPFIFISSHTGSGLMELKDVLWRELNS